MIDVQLRSRFGEDLPSEVGRLLLCLWLDNSLDERLDGCLVRPILSLALFPIRFSRIVHEEDAPNEQLLNIPDNSYWDTYLNLTCSRAETAPRGLKKGRKVSTYREL